MNILTDEKRHFAEENHNLILSFLIKRKLPIWESDPYNQEDWYGTAAIGYCKAVASYDETKGASFSTYAFRCMNNEVLHRYIIMNAQNKIPADMVASGDYVLASDGEDQFTLFDTIASPSCSEDYLVMKTDFERELAKENERTQKILRMLASGYTLDEVGREVGITRERVRQIKTKFVEKMGY